MTKKVFNMQGGKHSVLAYSALENRAYGSCVASLTSFVVSIGTGMGLNISTGDGLISVDTTFARRIQIDAVETVTVPAASASYGRIDSVVAYIDTSVTPDTSTTDNANNILKFIVVAGTAASTPVAPTDAAIQSAIGAGKPYMILYNALIPQNAVNTSGVTLTDMRNVLTVLKPGSVTNTALATNAIKLGYAQITGAFTISNPTNNSFANATGLSVSVNVPTGGRDLLIFFKGTVRSSATSGQGVGVRIIDSTMSTVVDALGWDLATSGFGVNAEFVGHVTAPTAGTHVYQIQIGHTSTASISILAGDLSTPAAGGVASILVLAI